MIKLDSVSIKLDSKLILSDITLEIKPGEIVCLLGPNGSGKTTLLRAISGVIGLCSGFIDVSPGVRLIPVFQGGYLWPHLTSLQNLELVVANLDITEQEKLGRIEHIIRRFNLISLINKYPHEMSGGEKQRVAIARAIVLGPDILLLDEITSALDVEQIRFVADVLLELKGSGVGILFITHHIGLAEKISDRYVFIDRQRVIVTGLTSELRQSESERLNTFLEYA